MHTIKVTKSKDKKPKEKNLDEELEEAYSNIH